MSRAELANIVLPLTAFVAANSSAGLLDPQAIIPWGSRTPAESDVQLHYQLDPRFFREETSLDEPLLALLRANCRGFMARSPILRMSLKLFYENRGYSYGLEAVLVISASRDVQREPCLKHVNRVLRTISRPGYICPLTDDEREELGRSLAPNRR